MAKYYDQLGWSEFSESLFPLLKEFVSNLSEKPSSYLDLACGTGVLAYKLASLNIKVTGVDWSPQMIKVARGKQNGFSNRPEFIQQDISKLKLDKKFDLAGCFFDSLNHLKSPALVRDTFKAVASHLNENSWFIFDIVTRLGLENWKPYYDSHPDLYYVREDADFDPDQNKARVKIEAFIKIDSKNTTHIKEVFDEICIPTEDIQVYLSEAGFSKILIKPFVGGDTLRDSERIMIYAKL